VYALLAAARAAAPTWVAAVIGSARPGGVAMDVAASTHAYVGQIFALLLGE
jgi:hypothetical protein